MALRLGLSCCLALLSVSACKETYRVGDRVIVKWCEAEYPAYVLARKGPTRFRVHLEGYEPRWDTEVLLDDIVGRKDVAEGPAPPLCPKVARALGIKTDEEKGKASKHQVGAHVRVEWRGSVYKATVVEVQGRDRFLVHYDGHSTAWDEVVSSDRILGAAR